MTLILRRSGRNDVPESINLVLLAADLVVFGRHPHRFLYSTLIRGEIDRPAAAGARNRVMRVKPAKNLCEAMAALRLAADEIEQPEIKEAHAQRRCHRHAGWLGNRSCLA
jgi:hypothetical protein